MNINWSTLIAIGVVAAAAALTVVLLVSLALVGLSAGSQGRPHAADHGPGSGTRSAAGTATAVICVLAAGLVVCYGLFLIIA